MIDAVSEFTERRAWSLFDEGMLAVEVGDYVTALNAFRASARLHRTAQALTHWGWMEHSLGDTDRAIELCMEAIGLEPQCGHAFNDIGSYLVVLGRDNEAITWFKRAIASERNDSRQRPHLNLGKVYFARGDYALALKHFELARVIAPDDPDVIEMIQAARARLLHTAKGSFWRCIWPSLATASAAYLPSGTRPARSGS